MLLERCVDGDGGVSEGRTTRAWDVVGFLSLDDQLRDGYCMSAASDLGGPGRSQTGVNGRASVGSRDCVINL